jgi:L-rhamnose mutarotase
MKLLLAMPALLMLVNIPACVAQQSQNDGPVEATKRYCLTLDLKEDTTLIREYKYWHMPEHIWPEIPKGIREVGIVDMEIYLLGTRLFMIMETTANFDFNKQMARLAELPRQKEWETFVSKFQKSLPGATSSEKWKLMDRIFNLP